jgi:hypothetical protein
VALYADALGVGDRAIAVSAASASQMGRFETKWLSRPEKSPNMVRTLRTGRRGKAAWTREYPGLNKSANPRRIPMRAIPITALLAPWELSPNFGDGLKDQAAAWA